MMNLGTILRPVAGAGLFVVGLVVVGTGANLIAFNGADNALHLVLGLALTGVGFGARLTVRPIR